MDFFFLFEILLLKFGTHSIIFVLANVGAIFLNVSPIVHFGFSDSQLLANTNFAPVCFVFIFVYRNCMAMNAKMPAIHFHSDFLTCFVHLDASQRGVQLDQIIFTDVAMKNEHIRRSSLADLFLDTYGFYKLSFSLY